MRALCPEFDDDYLNKRLNAVSQKMILSGSETWPEYECIIGAIALGSPTGASDTRDRKLKQVLRQYLTVYPNTWAPGERPAVNVNTAPDAVVRALVSEIPRLKTAGKTTTVSDWIIAQRPFFNWGDFEARLFTWVWEKQPEEKWSDCFKRKDPVSDDVHEPKMEAACFNDLMQSLNGTYPSRFSNLIVGSRTSGSLTLDENTDAVTLDGIDTQASGVYRMKWVKKEVTSGTLTTHVWAVTYDGVKDSDYISFDKDYHSNDPATTWCSAIKFSSQYFHIIVDAEAIGHRVYDRQGLTPYRDTVTGTQSAFVVRGGARLQAVYRMDGGSSGKVVWFKWNMTMKGNIGDY
jgi:hypothetical protein